MMADYSERALLPEGFHDDLPPDAEYEATVVERLLARFYAFGYERVAPPLVEFEESLLSGSGKTLARQMFRLMDPASQRMMGVRTDITIQVARIAATRLAAEPRPLRLCYAGQVLRVRGGQLRSKREFGQVGVELIGAAGPEADIEVLLVAADAIAAVGIGGLSIDLTVPTLVSTLAEELGLTKAAARTIRAALNAKDIGALQSLDGRAGTVFRGLLAAAGRADEALAALDRLKLPPRSAAIVAELAEVVGRMQALLPDLALTIDPGEARGFEYQSGISFTLFAAGGRGELGRGGRYLIPDTEGHAGTPAIGAIGVTLYLDSLLRVAPAPVVAAKVYLPFGTSLIEMRAVQDEGWRTVRGLTPEADQIQAARVAGCGHLYANGRVEQLD